MRNASQISLIHELSELPEDARADAIDEFASTWVSEHEGYNYIGYDRKVEHISEALSLQVEQYIETTKELS